MMRSATGGIFKDRLLAGSWSRSGTSFAVIVVGATTRCQSHRYLVCLEVPCRSVTTADTAPEAA